MKKVFILILIAIFLIAACKGQDKPSANEGDNLSPATDADVKIKIQDDEKSVTQKLADLIDSDMSAICTIKSIDENMVYEATVYFADGRSRYDMVSMDNNDQEIIMHTIYDEKSMYSWAEGSDQGMYIKLDDLEGMQGEDVKSQDEMVQEIEENQNVEYDCRAGLVEESKFDLPKNIEFVDMAEMLKNMQEQLAKYQN